MAVQYDGVADSEHLVHETDLATLRPDLAKELVDKSLASKLKPGTNKKVEWECLQGHRWFASPNSRVHMNSGCPVCAGKVLVKGENDLATSEHDSVDEPVSKLSVDELCLEGEHKVRLRCKKGHGYDVIISKHIQSGHFCPICAKQS